jgi:hypothetical protein
MVNIRRITLQLINESIKLRRQKDAFVLRLGQFSNWCRGALKGHGFSRAENAKVLVGL